MTEQAEPEQAGAARQGPDMAASPMAGLSGELCRACEARAVFTADECDRILALGQQGPMHDGPIRRAGAGIRHHSRQCRIGGVTPTDPGNRSIMQRIIGICAEFNNRHFGFEIESVGLPLELT